MFKATSPTALSMNFFFVMGLLMVTSEETLILAICSIFLKQRSGVASMVLFTINWISKERSDRIRSLGSQRCWFVGLGTLTNSIRGSLRTL